MPDVEMTELEGAEPLLSVRSSGIESRYLTQGELGTSSSLEEEEDEALMDTSPSSSPLPDAPTGVQQSSEMLNPSQGIILLVIIESEYNLYFGIGKSVCELDKVLSKVYILS